MPSEREVELLNKLCDAHDQIEELENKIKDLTEQLRMAKNQSKSHRASMETMHKTMQLKNKAVGKYKDAFEKERDAHTNTAKALGIALDAKNDMLLELELRSD